MSHDIIIPLFAATVQSGTPILFATLGEIITEKGGVLNLGVEGIMMVGALAGFVAAFRFGNPVLAVVIGGICGALLAAVHAIVCLTFQGNQVVSGLALTIFGTGLANFFGTPVIGRTVHGFSPFAFPVLSRLPFLGPIFFHQDGLVYFSYVLPLAIWFFLFRTHWGLRLRAIGEFPEAVAASGVRINRYRWGAVCGGGFFVGIGGAYLSLAYTHMWTNGLSAGRGWIAVALVIFAFWHPFRAMLGAYLFGGVMAFQLRLQAMGANVPSSLLLMLPYGLTIAVLVFASWKSRRSAAPAILGINISPPD